MSYYRCLKWMLIPVLLCMFAVSTGAVNVKQYSEGDGLPSRQVFDICTDNEGYVWIYTSAGLSRFDGSEFVEYTLDELDRSRNNAAFLAKLKTSADGVVKLSLTSGQFFAYNRNLDRFEKIFDLADHNIDARLNNFSDYGDTTVFCTTDGAYLLDTSGFKCVALKNKAVNDFKKIDGGGKNLDISHFRRFIQTLS